MAELALFNALRKENAFYSREPFDAFGRRSFGVAETGLKSRLCARRAFYEIRRLLVKPPKGVLGH